MYGAASLPAAQLPSIVQDIRAQLQQPDLPFGINLFVPPAELPPHTEAQQAALQQVHAYYADVAARLQLDCHVAAPTPDLAALQANFEAQVQVSAASCCCCCCRHHRHAHMTGHWAGAACSTLARGAPH